MENKIKINLPYGDSTLQFQVPNNNLLGVFAASVPDSFESVDKQVKNALANPIGRKRLCEVVRPDQEVVIIADDKTRPTPVKEILPFVLEELASAGVPFKNISIVFALGTHTPMTKEEMVSRVGRGVASRIKLYNSEFKDPAGLLDCGKAPDGTNIVIDKRVAEADFRIAIGCIIPHPECGWGGGGKIIYPGVASEVTVSKFHLSFGYVNWNTYGSEKNPVRLNMEKWVDTVGLDFIVNCVITSQDTIYHIVAGDYIKAHRKGIEYGREIYSVMLPQKADVVVVTSFRADEDFWLASKAIFAGELVVKDGGTLILVTPCVEGIGPHPEYSTYIGTDNWDELMEDAFSGKIEEPISVSAAVAIARMRQRISLSIVSGGLEKAEISLMKFDYFESVDEALNVALTKHGFNATVAVLPDGISTVPVLSNG